MHPYPSYANLIPSQVVGHDGRARHPDPLPQLPGLADHVRFSVGIPAMTERLIVEITLELDGRGWAHVNTGVGFPLSKVQIANDYTLNLRYRSELIHRIQIQGGLI